MFLFVTSQFRLQLSSPRRSRLCLVLKLACATFGIMPFNASSVFVQGTYTPLVHARVGRTDEPIHYCLPLQIEKHVAPVPIV